MVEYIDRTLDAENVSSQVIGQRGLRPSLGLEQHGGNASSSQEANGGGSHLRSLYEFVRKIQN